MRLIGPLIHSGQLLRALAANLVQGAPVQERHCISPTDVPFDTVNWIQWRGYRAAVASSPGSGVAPGVLFGRKNEPAMLAVVGDVLVWDGERIVIQE